MARKLKTYLVTYHSSAAGLKKIQKSSPEEMAAGMEAWMKWAKKCGPKLVEMGSPLAGGLKLTADADPAPSKRKVSGYSILQAASMAGAKALLKNHPHLSWAKGSEIEVHEASRMG